MRWGLGVDLVSNGSKLARAAQVYFDLIDEAAGLAAQGFPVDVEEIDEAAEILEHHLKLWWQATERFQASARREMDQAVAGAISEKIWKAKRERPWSHRRQAEVRS